MTPWTLKYLPKNTDDIVGQNAALASLKECILTYKFRKKRAILIYGPTGCGKTCAVYAIAQENNLEIIELNASDVRNKDSIQSILGAACKQQSLFSKGKIILLDEVDGLSGRDDKGGISAIASILTDTAFPIVMTSNDPFDKKFTPLRKKSEIIQFKSLAYPSVLAKLKNICQIEKILFEEDDLKALAMRSGGDLRGALSDLQILSTSGKLHKESLNELAGRVQEEKIHSALMKIFKTTSYEIAIFALDNVDEDLGKVMLWLDQNLPREYKKPADLCRAYDCLSKADIFWRRIRRWQHWRYLIYMSALMTAGVATAKDEKYSGFFAYQPTTRILKMWQANIKNKLKKDIAAKVAIKTRTSTKRVMQDTIPYLKLMCKNDVVLADAFESEFGLNSEESGWLRT